MIEAAVVGVHGRLDGDDLAACVCRVCERLTHGDSSTLEATRCGPVHCPHSTEAGGPARNRRPISALPVSYYARCATYQHARSRAHASTASITRGESRPAIFPRSISILDVNG